jgi:hypothetical protein
MYSVPFSGVRKFEVWSLDPRKENRFGDKKYQFKRVWNKVFGLQYKLLVYSFVFTTFIKYPLLLSDLA